MGKRFDASLADSTNISDALKQTEEWLTKIDKSKFPDKFKTRLYQHGLLPRLLWLLTVYEFPMTVVEGIERKLNKHLRRWLGVHSGPLHDDDLVRRAGVTTRSGRKWTANAAGRASN